MNGLSVYKLVGWFVKQLASFDELVRLKKLGQMIYKLVERFTGLKVCQTVYKQAEQLTSWLNEWLHMQTDRLKWQTGYKKGEVQHDFTLLTIHASR